MSFDPEATLVALPQSPPHESPGDGPARVGRFEIVSVIAAGGMGCVYRARDTEIGRDVALKLLLRGGRDPRARRAFLESARAMGRVRHPNVCPVYEVGGGDDEPYLVMPFVPETLDGVLRRQGPFPEGRAADLVRQVSLGVEAAHGAGLMHYDIKPANVLVDEGGRALLTDFLVPPDDIGWGQIFGTPSYMPPEQALGRHERTGPRSDVHGLGALLYKLLTNQAPYHGSTITETLSAARAGQVTPPGRIRPGLDPGLEAICLRAMARDPGDRFSSAAALANALDAYMAGQPVRADEPPRTSPSFDFVLPDNAVSYSELSPVREPQPETDQPDVRSDSGSFAPPPRTGGRSGGAGAPPAQRPVPMPPDPDPPSDPRTAVPRPITDQVHFSVTAPAALRAGHQHALAVWAHLDAQRDEVLRRAQQAHPLGPVQIHTKGPVRVARGTTLSVRVQVPAFGSIDESDVLDWTGDIGSATFAVAVPADTASGSYGGTVFVYVDGLQIARLNFDLQVAAHEAPAQALPVRQVRHRTAFASYASRDRDAVLARIQGIQKAIPDLDIFLDVASLRSGEKWAERLEREVTGRDVFYLFWSRNASRSEWVEREWRAALAARGVEYIDPVPLADPRAVPPPPELAAELHFNDWVLAYLRGSEAGHAWAPWVWVVAVVLALAALAAALLVRRPE